MSSPSNQELEATGINSSLGLWFLSLRLRYFLEHLHLLHESLVEGFGGNVCLLCAGERAEGVVQTLSLLKLQLARLNSTLSFVPHFPYFCIKD